MLDQGCQVSFVALQGGLMHGQEVRLFHIGGGIVMEESCREGHFLRSNAGLLLLLLNSLRPIAIRVLKVRGLPLCCWLAAHHRCIGCA